MLHVGNVWECAINNAGQIYQATGFQYTDPYGHIYTLAADGTLQSVQDLNNNTLTITPNGITSSNGLSVPFVRDSQGRITQITDTLGNKYQYGYDANGNLSIVTYPSIATPAQYQYDSTHLLTQQTDQRGNVAGTTDYFPDGKLMQVTDAVGSTTKYSYNTATNATTVTNPDGGTVVTTFDTYGKPLSIQDPLSPRQVPDIVMESSSPGNIVASYAFSERSPLWRAGASATSYYLGDGLSSTVGLTNQAGTETDRYRYDAYGQPTLPPGPTPNPFQYRGQWTDSLTGFQDLVRATTLQWQALLSLGIRRSTI